MASPQIMILVSLAVITIVYAFVCDIRLSNQAGKISKQLAAERPDLWEQMNAVARNWRGGQPALKLLYRRGDIDLAGFAQQYAALQKLEHRMLWSMAIGAGCIVLVVIGSKLGGWQW